MRSIFIASAAALALGTSLTPVAAAPFHFFQHGPFAFLGQTIEECVDRGDDNNALVTMCGHNSGGDPHHGSNDDNTQRIHQDVDYRGYGVPKWDLDPKALAIAVNNDEQGDHNYQSVTQNVDIKEVGGTDDHSLAVLAVGVNDVEDGDNNSQSIYQDSDVTIVYSHGHGHDGMGSE